MITLSILLVAIVIILIGLALFNVDYKYAKIILGILKYIGVFVFGYVLTAGIFYIKDNITISKDPMVKDSIIKVNPKDSVVITIKTFKK